MFDEKILEKANQAIIDARQVIERAEAALRHAAEIERAHGLSKGDIENYLARNFSDSQREEIELIIQRSINAMREAAENEIAKQKERGHPLRIFRISKHI